MGRQNLVQQQCESLKVFEPIPRPFFMQSRADVPYQLALVSLSVIPTCTCSYFGTLWGVEGFGPVTSRRESRITALTFLVDLHNQPWL